MDHSAQPDARPGERGAILLVVLAALVIVGVLAATLATLVSGTQETTVVQQTGNQAFYMAESGGRYAIARLRAEKLAAVADLDGQTFTLGNDWGFELTVDTTDTGPTYIFSIDSVGFIGSGANSQRQSLNGYLVEVPKYDDTINIPTAFNYSVQAIGDSPITLSGSSYVDSYDSAVGDWTSAGAGSAAVIRSAGTEDVLKISGSSQLYGSVSVPSGTDTEDYQNLVKVPGYYGESQIPAIVAEDAPAVTTITAPDEPAEIAKPTSWDPVPSLKGWGSQSISGGSFSTSGDFNPSSTSVTVMDDLSLNVGDDFTLSGSGSLLVDGAFDAWVADTMKITGGGTGLTVHGDADIQVGGDFEVSGSQQVVVDGDLDLDVGGTLKISGSGSLHVKGDMYIDVTEEFKIEGGGSLIVDGNVIIKVGENLKFSGYQYPLTIGEDASVQIYVADGDIDINSSQINLPYTPAKFLVFGSDNVESVSISGSGKVVGAILAPAADFSLSGSSQLFGAVVADSVTINGNSSIHYDEALSRVSPPVDVTEYPLRRYWIAVGSMP